MDVPQAEFEKLVKSVGDLAAGREADQKVIAELTGLLRDKQGPNVLKKITDRIVSLRFVNGKAVIGYKNRGVEARPQYVYEKKDPIDQTKTVLFVDLILEGETEAFPIDYNEFLREAERVECTVKKVEETEWTINQGYVKRKEVDEYSTVELPNDVPVDIVGRSRVFTVNVPSNGASAPRELAISEHYVNI